MKVSISRVSVEIRASGSYAESIHILYVSLHLVIAIYPMPTTTGNNSFNPIDHRAFLISFLTSFYSAEFRRHFGFVPCRLHSSTALPAWTGSRSPRYLPHY